MLSPQQLAFFRRFGYICIRQLYTPVEVEQITEAFERTMDEFGPPAASNGDYRKVILGPIQHVPRMNALLDHPRILELAGSILGDDFNYACGDGNFYTGDTGWHPDGSWGQLFACKIVTYLDPLTRSTGALRVIPGSHEPTHPIRQGLIDFTKLKEVYGLEGRDYPGSEAIETQPGDVIMFNHDTYHASFGGGKRRRMFTMNLTRHCESEADLQRLREYLSIHSPGGYKLPIGGMYFRPILETASPSRMAHLSQCKAMHDELFPQLKGEMSHRQQVDNMLRVMYPDRELAAIHR